MFENVSKEEWVRWGVIAIFVIFITSTIAQYMSAGASFGGGVSPGGSGPTQANQSLDTFDGQGSATVTLLSWDPALRVTGANPELEPMLAQWKREGRLILVQNISEGQRIIRLSSGAQVYNLSQRLMALDLSVSADGLILIPWAQMQGPGISINATGDNFPFHAVPQYEVGDSFPVQFSGRVVGGKLMSYGQIYFVPVQAVAAELVPENITVVKRFFNIVVPWESRHLDSGQLEVDMVGGSRVIYKPQSYVNFDPPLTSAQLSAIAQNLPPYAGGVLQPGVMSVKANMTDKPRLLADLAAIGVASAQFPTSTMEVYPWEGGQSDDELAGYVKGRLNHTYPGLEYQILPGWRLQATLPASIEAEGQEYTVVNRTIEFRSLSKPIESGTLKLSFNPVGRKVFNYTYAQYSPRGILVSG